MAFLKNENTPEKTLFRLSLFYLFVLNVFSIKPSRFIIAYRCKQSAYRYHSGIETQTILKIIIEYYCFDYLFFAYGVIMLALAIRLV
jgi:hypothetical protein